MLLQGMMVVLAVFLVLVVGGGFVLSVQSQTPPPLGPVGGHLRPCPDTPNCVCSQASPGDAQHAIAALGHADWQAVRHAVEAAGGRIERDDGHYLHARSHRKSSASSTMSRCCAMPGAWCRSARRRASVVPISA